MKNKNPDSGLPDQMKKELREAKTKAELDILVSSAGMELSDDELDAAAGAGEIPCPRNICPADAFICVTDFR